VNRLIFALGVAVLAVSGLAVLFGAIYLAATYLGTPWGMLALFALVAGVSAFFAFEEKGRKR
jgi:cytochrome b subunit of formate dehydrogenase